MFCCLRSRVRVIVFALIPTGAFLGLGLATQASIVGHWTFDSDATASTGVDGSLLAGAVINNLDSVAGGGSLDVSGDQDFVRIDGGDGVANDGNGYQGVAGAADRTLSMWVKGADPTPDPNVKLFAGWGDTGGGTQVRYDFGIEGGTADQFRNELNAGAMTSDTGSPILDNTWHHVAITLDSGTTTFYLDGVPYGTGATNVNTSAIEDMVLGTGIRQATGTSALDRWFDGLIDDVQIYDNSLPLGGIEFLFNNPGQVATAAFEPELTIDRATGAVSLVNATDAPIQVIGYSLLSDGGAFDQTSWTTVTGNYDASAAPPGGSIGFDTDDNWTILSSPSSSTDLSETELDGGDGGTLPAFSGALDLGTPWIQSPIEDVTAKLLFDNGTVLDLSVSYTGDALELGDLDGMNGIDAADWIILRDNLYTDLTGLSTVAAYAKGDLDFDGTSDIPDFLLFKQLYDDANGAGAFAAMAATVPEPSTLMMVILGSTISLCFRPRGSQR